MKLAVMALLTMALLSVNAQAEGLYLGAGLGKAKIDFDDSSLNATSRDSSDLGFKVYSGYQFNDHIGAELGYVNFGKLKNTYNILGTNVGLDAKVYGVYLAAVGKISLSEQLSLLGKVGVTTNHSSLSASANNFVSHDSGSKTDAIIGVGAEYAFNKNMGVSFQYENFGKAANDVKVNIWSANVTYKF